MTTLTFDIGQTGVRARVAGRGRAPVEVAGEGYRSGTSLEDALAMVARMSAQASGVRQFETVAGGMTGVYGHVPDIDGAARRLRLEFGVKRLVVADDAVTSYLGAIGRHPGVVVAIGTGLVAIGRGDSGEWARVDGVGAMIGDEGAGWWIGRQGLIAALSAADGREGGSRRLLAAAERRYGLYAAIPRAIAGSPSPIAAVADFARDVAEAARGGDTAARAIWDQAAEFIGRAIAAAASRARVTSPVGYALVGGISRSADLLEPALARYLERWLGVARRIKPSGDSLDGAGKLLALADAGALGDLARTANSTKDEC